MGDGHKLTTLAELMPKHTPFAHPFLDLMKTSVGTIKIAQLQCHSERTVNTPCVSDQRLSILLSILRGHLRIIINLGLISQLSHKKASGNQINSATVL